MDPRDVLGLSGSLSKGMVGARPERLRLPGVLGLWTSFLVVGHEREFGKEAVHAGV